MSFVKNIKTAEQVTLEAEVSKKQKRAAEIDQRLAEIDQCSVRPLRAINAGTATEYDRNRLAELDTEAETLRQELASL